MKITISEEKFHNEWKSTGEMIKETPTSFIQTYRHPRFEGKFKQVGYENSPFGKVVIMKNI